MYEHHKESIENMIQYFREIGAEALILIGSVAKGRERIDSDLDCVVVLSDEAYKIKEEKNATSDTVDGRCTYPGGYFDVKYVNPEYLRELADKGSEPARSTYTNCKILFHNNPELEGIIAKIPVFQQSEKEEKMLSFYSDFWLNYYYFLKCCNIDGFMKMRTIAEIIYTVYRMLLQENEILFDCNRRLEQQVADIDAETRELVELAKAAQTTQSMESVDAFVNTFLFITKYKAPNDMACVFTTYAHDFQEWWRDYRPNIGEW